MTIAVRKSSAGVGVLVIFGEKKGRSFQAAFHRDDRWFGVWYWSNLRSVGITLFRISLILDTWTWRTR